MWLFALKCAQSGSGDVPPPPPRGFGARGDGGGGISLVAPRQPLSGSLSHTRERDRESRLR